MFAFLFRCPLSTSSTPICPTSQPSPVFPQDEKCKSSSPRPDTPNFDLSLESRPASPVSTVRHASIAADDLGSPPSGRCQRLSTPRVFAAHVGAALTLFLATTDSTIVSTSLPTISQALGFSASAAAYTWVGVAYMLTQTACQPLYGRISDLVGRKSVLFTSIVIFAVGSLLCGAAQNVTWLIVARGISGVGGGGIVCCVWVITSEIVEVPANRAKWSQALSVTWCCSAVAGPLLGGVFSGGSTGLSWRWAFYLNLPICIAAVAVLALSLQGTALHSSKDASWDAFLRKFDFVGLILFISGTSSIIVGFSFASASGWKAPSTLALIIVGIAILLSAGIYEMETTREALFPPLAFKSVNVVIILVVNFLHNFAFNSGTFYLARYYQTGDKSTLQASLMLLPYSLGSSLASIPAAWVIGYFQRHTQNNSGQRYVISLGLFVSTVGFGLMYLLRDTTPTIMGTMLPLVAGFGLGMLFHAPYQVFSSALPPRELATGTSAFFLVRFTGATVGLAISGAVFENRLARTVVQPVTPSETLRTVTNAIQTVWVLCTPCLAVAFLLSLFLRPLSVMDPSPTHASKGPQNQKLILSTPKMPGDLESGPAM